MQPFLYNLHLTYPIILSITQQRLLDYFLSPLLLSLDTIILLWPLLQRLRLRPLLIHVPLFELVHLLQILLGLLLNRLLPLAFFIVLILLAFLTIIIISPITIIEPSHIIHTHSFLYLLLIVAIKQSHALIPFLIVAFVRLGPVPYLRPIPCLHFQL